MELNGQTIAILGAGRSGLGAARLARKLGARPVVFDTGDAGKLTPDLAKLRAENFEFIPGLEGAKQSAAQEKFNLVVISPGIDASWELPRIFTSLAVPLIGEIEFAWRQLRDTPVVAITGTNGKTTTTELIERMFNGCGRKTIACGNYGHPLCEVAASGVSYDVLTVEISSFQLETITSFAPRVGIWLNFAPDHLDRYPDMNSYFGAKRRLFDYMTSDDIAIVREGESLGALQSKTVTFSTAAESKADFTLRDQAVYFRNESIAAIENLPLQERHNIENEMAALAAGWAMGLKFPEMTRALSGYESAQHRCEVVREYGGHRYINDSKATNLHAVESCLRSQDASVVLIAGGKEKGIDYASFRPLLREKVSALVAIGEIGDKLCAMFADDVPCSRAASVPDAVHIATGLARPGQDIVFSPGTSSFDMFSGYAERGNVFRDAVISLT
ncbi:MAG: UDP-N-acetylmuramoyl-L-alanine--D-glutamate ligase [Verrucomicrobia bacterium]|nr:UDP-N-acetylmuramoyl-L-alanine--D-glutamate ligase [Verrucomicrobiota bacterium]